MFNVIKGCKKKSHTYMYVKKYWEIMSTYVYSYVHISTSKKTIWSTVPVDQIINEMLGVNYSYVYFLPPEHISDSVIVMVSNN